MAINTFDKKVDKIPSKYSSIKGPSCHMLQLCITTDGSITSSDSKSSKVRERNRNAKSPYLTGDSVQVLSRVTEKKVFAQHKKTGFVSSFPLAASIYRANSDEFKLQKKTNKKVKKSVLTLPNSSPENPQMCTVSDTNDSKYVDTCDVKQNVRSNKRLPQNRKPRIRNKNYEFYDRDARYCSQMNINLDCSSTDMITGDGKRIGGKICGNKDSPTEQEFNAHDVWAVLRNINRFQFRPSPPISEDSIKTIKRKKTKNKKKSNRKDTRVIETTRTEEFAYISSYDVDSKSPISFSQASSFDRITVIDNKQDELRSICEDIEKKIPKQKNTNSKNQSTANEKKRRKINNRIRTTAQKEHDEQAVAFKNVYKRDISPVIPLKSELENPETLVEMKLMTSDKPEKKFVLSANKFKEPTICNGLTSRRKGSSGTLHSGSSKAAFNTFINLQQDSKADYSLQMKGITKVILNNGRINETQNKIRIETTLPSTAIPKMTKTEIKRRLASLKFPIVVLGKDQLSSTPFRIENYEPPHLQGLDQQMWPFMQDWYNKTKDSKNIGCKRIDNVNQKLNGNLAQKNKYQSIERKICRKQNETNKQVKDKNLEEEFSSGKKKFQKKFTSSNGSTKTIPPEPKKSKPIIQLKDKMLKLLYKNASARDIDEQNKKYDQALSTSCVRRTEVNPIIKVDAATETFVNVEHVPGPFRNTRISPRLDKKPSILTKQPRAKWASDIIDTVIKKIRMGIYYNQENKNQLKIMGLKEISVQTEMTSKDFNIVEKHGDFKEKINNDSITAVSPIDRNKYLGELPGFNGTLPALEIKTFNMKEIAVKHCTTNVMVQFDIAMPSVRETIDPLNNSSTFVPLTVTESHTRIFKCKTTIINAMLPAEICSLLPKIIKSIINSNKPPPAVPALPTSTVPLQNDSNLYTIEELTNCESQDIFNPILFPTLNIPPELIKLLNGIFVNRDEHKTKSVKVPVINYSSCKNDISFAKPFLQRVFPWNVDPFFTNLFDFLVDVEPHTNVLNYKKPCTSLVLYEKTNYPLSKIYTTSDRNMLESNWYQQSSNRINKFTNAMPLLFIFDDDKITVNLTKYNRGVEEKSSIIISNFNLETAIKGFKELVTTTVIDQSPVYAIDMNKKDKESNNFQTSSSTLKTRKNKFVKLYKKCKSTSSISGEKNSTPLNKISTLEDFLHALGTAKTLASIFDGFSGKKILSSLLEMKNWITEISQRQAMLILLLTNKKDTPNLIRFRPVLLQGIAVNRITRASELDMEIEVIEREHFNKFSKYENVPYMTECVENHDILMEELYWIAKTTASDYQKPFNEASEKLLKSLLEKRKKLNPSYLRVMARYVGLGLLKPSSCKN